MEKRYYPQVDETLYREKLENGLTVLVVPRPGFRKKLCYFAADYGSIHRSFRENGEDFSAPMGVAHYLEHTLFSKPGRDIPGEFAALGASPNAFTGYDMTAYYFVCTDYFDKCLELLLDFVSKPSFTAEAVEKERGIITQEILMNKDNPDTVIFEELMQKMYTAHPAVEPILGTEESVQQITPEILQRCHNAFYHPSNMVLCVVGDVNPEEVVTIARNTLPNTPLPQVERLRQWPEEMTCATHLTRTNMEVAMPTFQLSFKAEDVGQGKESVIREIIGELAAETLFGESSPLYLRLYDQGIIDNSFGGGFDTMEGLAMLSAGGDSLKPELVLEGILESAQTILREGLDPDTFMRMKRSSFGRRIRGLDSFDPVCFRLCACHFVDFDYFELPGLYQQVQPADILEFIEKTVTPERACLCVIDPL